MSDSPDTVRSYSPFRQGTDGLSPVGFLSGGWRRVEPMYIWSALIGIAVAFVLIGVGLLMQTHTLQ
jgi:hypothetical protein